MKLAKYDVDALHQEITKKSTAADKAIAKVTAFAIDEEDDKQKAGRWLVEAKDLKAGFVAWREEVVPDLFQAHKKAVRAFKALIEPYEKVIVILSRKLVDYDAQKLREAREEERRIRQEQEEEAEKERAAIQAEADEAKRKGDAELHAELSADAKAATEIVAHVAVPARATKVEGTVQRSTWKAEVIDLEELPLEFCKPKVADMSALNLHARKFEDKAEVPGVRFFKDTKYV